MANVRNSNQLPRLSFIKTTEILPLRNEEDMLRS